MLFPPLKINHKSSLAWAKSSLGPPKVSNSLLRLVYTLSTLVGARGPVSYQFVWERRTSDGFNSRYSFASLFIPSTETNEVTIPLWDPSFCSETLTRQTCTGSSQKYMSAKKHPAEYFLQGFKAPWGFGTMLSPIQWRLEHPAYRLVEKYFQFPGPSLIELRLLFPEGCNGLIIHVLNKMRKIRPCGSMCTLWFSKKSPRIPKFAWLIASVTKIMAM